MANQAFILRISPSGIDRVSEALESDQLIIGWANAQGLLSPNLDWAEFRQIVSDEYHSDQPTMRKAGAAAGQMWRFIRSMQIGDLVVVPHGSNFFVAEVSGAAVYLEEYAREDTAYRRPVAWLNNRQPIPRATARAALVSRMKTYGTCADASDLVEEIQDCLAVARSGNRPKFKDDLEARLIQEALSEMRSGRLDSFGFEDLIRTTLLNLGATEAIIVPRNLDKGADIVATFRVAGAISQKVAVQAKHWQPEPPVDHSVVEQLIAGIEAEEADLGMVVTTGSISKAAVEAAAAYCEDKGVKIELIDGEQFAKMIVEYGAGES